MLILPVLLECLLSLSLCGELINEAVLLRRKRYRDEPIAVMVGVIVDAQRMHVTKSDWRDLLISLSHVVGRSVEEIHTRDFYAGMVTGELLTGIKEPVSSLRSSAG